MNFYIVSQKEVVKVAYKYKNNAIAVISIIEPEEAKVDFSKAIIPEHRILRLQFDDIDRPVGTHTLFTIKDAKKVLEFIQKHIGSVDFFLVHCHAGISRSAGVAAALSKIYNKDDSHIFTCGKYLPNMFVYKTILNEYFSNQNRYL